MDSIIHNLIILKGFFNGDKLGVDSGVGFDLLLAFELKNQLNSVPGIIIIIIPSHVIMIPNNLLV